MHPWNLHKQEINPDQRDRSLPTIACRRFVSIVSWESHQAWKCPKGCDLGNQPQGDHLSKLSNARSIPVPTLRNAVAGQTTPECRQLSAPLLQGEQASPKSSAYRNSLSGEPLPNRSLLHFHSVWLRGNDGSAGKTWFSGVIIITFTI